jgi:hypothetical protein
MNLLERIQKRKALLTEVSAKLKTQFFGIDSVIDKIIKNIEVWYIMPELLTRPVIICLWGMTGVGKTDLIRKLVRYLNFHDRYVEIQLTNKGHSEHAYGRESLKSFISYSNLEPDAPGVLLLDEIQRFRTVNENGEEIHDGGFQDLWMMLSDGKFSSDHDLKNEMLKMVWEIAFRKDGGRTFEDEDGLESKPGKKYKYDHYSAYSFKKMLRLREPIEDIMQWDEDQRKAVLLQKLTDSSAYLEEDYSKTLIFVSGNLDEVYKMASNCEEAEFDADIFHKNSLKINMLHVKRALKQRFKPEQIARFGNVHVIYPSLSKAAYWQIIDSKIAALTSSVAEKFEIELKIDHSVKETIYRNGVFPVQGTRPLFSTISSMLENSIPSFVYSAVNKKQKSLTLHYDSEKKEIFTNFGSEDMRFKIEGDIDLIRDRQFDKDIHATTVVHECGHSLAYALLFRMAPTQISANHASVDAEGFVAFHDIDLTAKSIKDKIAVILAGQVAEEIFFGRDNLSAGCSGDIRSATMLAADFYRNYAMGPILSKVATPYNSEEIPYNNDFAATDRHLESLLQQERSRIEKQIREWMPLLNELVGTLFAKKIIEPEEMRDVCGRHGLKIGVADAGIRLSADFADELEKKIGNGLQSDA